MHSSTLTKAKWLFGGGGGERGEKKMVGNLAGATDLLFSQNNNTKGPLRSNQ